MALIKIPSTVHTITAATIARIGDIPAFIIVISAIYAPIIITHVSLTFFPPVSLIAEINLMRGFSALGGMMAQPFAPRFTYLPTFFQGS